MGILRVFFFENHDFLRDKLCVKHYAVDRQIIRILHSRALNGNYKRSEVAEAYLRVSDVLLKEGGSPTNQEKRPHKYC